MTRVDGREDSELREVAIVYERLDRVDGSARFGFGSTQTFVSVSGPIEARLASESPSHATLDIHVRPLATVPGTDAKALAAILKSVFTPSLLLSHLPRTQVQIVCQALSGNDSGSAMGSVGKGWRSGLITSLVNATTAALISANSIPMSGVVCAVSVGRLPSSEDNASRLVLDPSESEQQVLTGGGCFAFLFSALVPEEFPSPSLATPSCAMIWTNYVSYSSVFEPIELQNAKALAQTGAVEVWQALKESVADLDCGSGLLGAKVAKAAVKVDESVADDNDAKMEI